MKHFAISAALVAGFGVALINPAQAANDGVITITGELLDTTCSIEGEDPGMNLVDKQVEMKKYPKSALSADGEKAIGKYFDIKIGGPGETECANGLTAYVRFDTTSSNIDAVTGRLKNTDTTVDGAQNVQVGLANGVLGGGTDIDLRTEDSAGQVIAGNEARIPLVASYYAVGGAATKGLVKTDIGFSVVYD